MRFIENHDEPRAAATFPPARREPPPSRRSSQTGARLVHEGQLDGRTRAAARLPRPPARRAARSPACGRSTSGCSRRSATPSSAPATGSSASAAAGTGNDTWQNLVAWGWRGDGPRKLVVVNLGDAPAAGHVSLPWDDLRGRAGSSPTRRRGEAYERSGDDLRDGLYVALDPWAWHLFDLTPSSRKG